MREISAEDRLCPTCGSDKVTREVVAYGEDGYLCLSTSATCHQCEWRGPEYLLEESRLI